jgi:hypothetical protein
MQKIIFSAFFNIASSEDQDTCLLEYCLHVLQLSTDWCVHRWGSQQHVLSRVLFWAANHQEEDVANNCSITTTLFSKRLWVWFWTTMESWLTSTGLQGILIFHCFRWCIDWCGIAIRRLMNEEEAAIRIVPCHLAIHCSSWSLQFFPHHSLFGKPRLRASITEWCPLHIFVT